MVAKSAIVNVQFRTRGLWRIRVASLLLRLLPALPVARLANRIVAPGVAVETRCGNGDWRRQSVVHADVLLTR